MACIPRVYNSFPPFLTMATKEPSGTVLTLVESINPFTGQKQFFTHRGDSSHAYEGWGPTALFKASGGKWRRLDKDGKAVNRIYSAPSKVLDVAHAMKEAGGRALLVGGSVRDMLLGQLPKDFDIEVYGMPAEEIESIVVSLGPEKIETVGRAFGVITARFNELDVDISIPRHESKQGTGHKGFKVTGDPSMTVEDAARRRDFTINSMAYDPLTGEIIDPFNGRKDLAAGILRATDLERFRDDPLRVLRTAQFAGRFGFKVDKETVAVCQEMTASSEFTELPPGRVNEEWQKLLLKSPKPSLGIDVGSQIGAWGALHPELAALHTIAQDSTWHPEGDVWTHSLMAVDVASEIVRREGLEGDDALVILLGALCHDFGKPQTTEFKDGRWRSWGHHKEGVAPTERFLERMGIKKDIQERVTRLVAEHMFLALNSKGDITDSAIKRLARRLDSATIQELVFIMEADVTGRGVEVSKERTEGAADLISRARELEVSLNKPTPILMGRHLIEHLTWEPGPRFSRVLKDIFEAQLRGEINTLEEALAMAASFDS